MEILSKSLSWVQMDITARCQASCLECSRNIDGGPLNPQIGKSDTWDLSLNIIKKFITPSMLKGNLKNVEFNGNFGDPCIHPNLIDILQYIINNNNKLTIRLNTNGAMFNDDYWIELANILKCYENNDIIFAVDGLEDTHHIYRRNTKFEDVINHAKAFINAGGKAIAQFIEFDHNSHQIDEWERRMKDIGFFDTRIRRSRVSTHIMNSVGSDYNLVGKSSKKQSEYNVNIPYKSKSYIKVKEIMNKQLGKELDSEITKEDVDLLMDVVPITCTPYETKGLYLEYDGTVNMCCYLGDQHKNHDHKKRNEWYTKIYSRYGKDFNNLHYHTLEEILRHDYFTNYLESSWNSKTTDKKTPRLKQCSKMCGVWYERPID